MSAFGLTPFEIEYLRAAASNGAHEPSDFDTFCWSEHCSSERLREARLRLTAAGYLDADVEVTDAGRATLLALGVTW